MKESKTATTEFKNAEYCGSGHQEAGINRAEGKSKNLITASSRRLLQFLLAMAIVPAEAQTFSVLHSFSGADGANPNGGLVLSGGTLYGTAEAGGSSANGVVFKVNTNGTKFAVLHYFDGLTNGGGPQAGLILSEGLLFGAANFGGTGAVGTVFKINTDGSAFTVLHAFNAFAANDGANPSARLLLWGGTLYGTTVSSTAPAATSGSVFALSPSVGGFNVLHSFNISDGADLDAPVVAGSTGLYGTAPSGGPLGYGEVFSIQEGGLSLVHVFNFSTDGANPSGGVLPAPDGGLYGTTDYGGVLGYGTVYKIGSQTGEFVVIHDFVGSPTQPNPFPSGGLVLSGRTLYGTTEYGGSAGLGTVFAVNTDGTGFTNLYTFTGGTGGSHPTGGLLLSGGTLYGTASAGGAGGKGTVFSLQVGASSGTLPVLLLSPQRLGTNFSFGFFTVRGQNYTVQHNDDLRATNWISDTNVVGNGGPITFAAPVTAAAHRFFRVIQP